MYTQVFYAFFYNLFSLHGDKPTEVVLKAFRENGGKKTSLAFLLKDSASSQWPLDVEDETDCRCEAQ